jgi:cell division protein FtsB
MSEIDRQVAALDSMDKDELRTACEEQLFEIEVLKTDLEVMKKQNTLLKEEIKSIKEGVKD